MAKITLATVTGNGAVTLNANFSTIVTAIENTLSRDGTTPNQMESDFDMNSNHIINLPAPTSNAHAATKEYVDDEIVNALENITGPNGLASIAAITQDDGQIIIGNGTKWVGESGATARASLGLTIGSDVQAYSSVLASTTASFTTALESKLSGIETSATADQTGAEIKSLYEAENDTNAFTDALLSKLNGIESNADVTDTTNVTAAGAAMLTGATFTGNVGIGVSPSSRLHVRDDTDTVADFIFQNTDQRLQIKTYWESGVGQYSIIQSTNDAEAVGQILSLNPSGGNVGINTTSPSWPLTVEVTSSTTEAIVITNGTDGARSHMRPGEYAAQNSTLNLWDYDTQGIIFYQGSSLTEIARFNTGADFGIGTGSIVDRRLHVQDTVSTIAKFERGGSSAGVGLEFGNTNGTIPIFFQPSSGTAMDVFPDASDEVSLGTSSNPFYDAHFEGTVTVGSFQDVEISQYVNGSDVQGLIAGTTLGGFIQGRPSGHLAVGIRGNDGGDGFHIVSGGGNYDTDSTYDTRVASFYVGGDVDFPGPLAAKIAHNGSVSGTLTETSHGRGHLTEVSGTTTFSSMSSGAHGVLVNDTGSAITLQRASGTITLYRNGVSVVSFQIPARGVGRFYYTSTNVVYYSGDVV